MDTSTIDFLSCLWQGGQYSYYWTAPKKRSYWLQPQDVGSAFCPNGGQNVYFGVNPVCQIPATSANGEPRKRQYVRSQISCIECVNALFGEFDFKDWGNLDNIRQHLKDFPFPSIVIHSGGGVHLYWLLSQTFQILSEQCRDRIRSVQANWTDYIRGDKQSKDLARVLRVPGTRNYKKCYAPNFPTVEFIKQNYNLTYSLNELEQLSQPPPMPEPSPLPPLPRLPDSTDKERFARWALTNACNMVRDSVDGEKHGTLLRAARLLGGYIAGGIVSESEAVAVLQAEIGCKAGVDDMRAAHTTIEKGLAYGMAEPITLEQKLQEMELWRREREPRVENGLDRQYWGRQFVGFWERVR